MSAKYACMADHAGQYPVRLMARVLAVSVSGYYAARQRPRSARAAHDAALTTHIAVVHQASRGTYGAPRIHAALQQAGTAVGRKRVARLMRAAALRGHTPRRWRAAGRSDPHATPGNVLARAFTPSAALNTVWGADITYLPYRGGTAYLAVVLDLASRAVVGWALAPHLGTSLPATALRAALAARPHRGATLHHSDRGAQYVSAEYRALLAAHRLTPSLSAPGNCYDNAVVESFFATLKRECPLAQHHALRDVQHGLAAYIDHWYNRHRLHSSLDYQAPLQYEQSLRRSSRVA